MIDMDYVHVDNLNVDQVMIDDLIEIDGEIVTITSIAPLRYGYLFSYKNDFGETETQDFTDDATFKLFLLM